jgi:hypothetical protein
MANDVKLGYGACQNPNLCALLEPVQEKLPLLPIENCLSHNTHKHPSSYLVK